MCLDLFSVKVDLFSRVIMDVTCTTPVQSVGQLWYYIKMLKITFLKNCEMVVLEG